MNIEKIFLHIDSSIAEKEKEKEKYPYVIVRTYSAGVFAGYLYKKDGKEVILKKARRIWSWKGAASLSQLATEGTSCLESCKFPCEVEAVCLLEAIEILSVTKKAKLNIAMVPVWRE